MKVGSRVKVIGSFLNDKYNPRDVEGTIVSMDGNYNPIEVLWDNGVKNAYTYRNLTLV